MSWATTGLVALGLLVATTAPAEASLVRKNPCERLDVDSIKRNDAILGAVVKFNAGDYKGAMSAFGAIDQAALIPEERTFVQYGEALLQARRGKGSKAIEAVHAAATSLPTSRRCALRAMLEYQPWSLNVGKIFDYDKRALRRLKPQKFVPRADDIERFGTFYFDMRARVPFLNVKICFDSFNAIRNDLSGERRRVVERVSENLDMQQAQLFSDGASPVMVGSE